MIYGPGEGCRVSIDERNHDRGLTDNEYREIAEELAEQDWDRFSPSVRDFVMEYASDYIEGFARGGDHAAEALKMMRRDCIGYLADLMDSERVTERARDLFTETT